MNLHDIAKEVLEVLGTGRQLDPFSKVYPDFGLKDAYNVTATVRAQREARGERSIGRKIGFTCGSPHPTMSRQALENAEVVASNCLTASHSVKPPFQHPKQGRGQEPPALCQWAKKRVHLTRTTRTMARNKLTAAEVANAGDGVHGDGDGLNLRIKGASRKWIYRYTRDGKVTELGLGSAHAVPLKLARKLRDQHEQALAQGLDPRSERSKRKVVAKTFAEAAEELIAARRQKWRANATTGRETSLSEWRVHLGGVCKPIAKRPVGEITVEDIKPIVKPYFDRGKSDTGRRLLKRIERVFAFAKAHGWRTADNPASWEIFEHILQDDGKSGPQPMHPALDWRELPAFMARLRSSRETMSRLALEMIILTACRSGEVRGARWDEMDLDTALWTLPPARMKRQREHVVPLSPPAIAFLRRLEAAQTGNYVFPGQETVISHTSNLGRRQRVWRREGDRPRHEK